MRSIDGYLSREVQILWPDALVTHDDETSYQLERPGEPPLGLGRHYPEARQAVAALRRAEHHRRRAADSQEEG